MEEPTIIGPSGEPRIVVSTATERPDAVCNLYVCNPNVFDMRKDVDLTPDELRALIAALSALLPK